jgi:hypothetical protein
MAEFFIGLKRARVRKCICKTEGVDVFAYIDVLQPSLSPQLSGGIRRKTSEGALLWPGKWPLQGVFSLGLTVRQCRLVLVE